MESNAKEGQTGDTASVRAPARPTYPPQEKIMRRTVPAVAVLALGVSLTLSGCFANPLEQLTEGLVRRRR